MCSKRCVQELKAFETSLKVTGLSDPNVQSVGVSFLRAALHESSGTTKDTTKALDSQEYGMETRQPGGACRISSRELVWWRCWFAACRWA